MNQQLTPAADQAIVVGSSMAGLLAALVVDASGRASRAPQWLRELGYTPPAETTINSLLGYASRWYHRPEEQSADRQGILINPRAPHQPRAGVLYPVEGQRWVVTLIGIGGIYPPTDEAGFLEFARALDDPAVYAAIKTAEPLTPIYGYRRTENRVRHYERLAAMPEGFVLLGDAVCAFNPVYGQGMTVAAMAAEALDEVLRQPGGGDRVDRSAGLARRFQRRLAEVNATPWLMATGADLNWPTTVGGNLRRRDRLVQRYMDRVIRLTTQDVTANRVFLEVGHLLRPPSALFAPQIIAGVLRQAMHA